LNRNENQKPNERKKAMNTNSILLLKNGQYAGPYSKNEVAARVESGAYALNDLAFCDGSDDPVALSRIIDKPPVVRPHPPCGDRSAAELLLIADKQKAIIVVAVLVVVIGFAPIPAGLQSLSSTAWWAIQGSGIFLCYKLAGALQKKVWLWVLLAACPLVNLFAYARIVSQAAKTLKANGIPVGMLGADRIALARLAQQAPPQPQI
jgi:hypothetical protein